jgi:hypothetical protein
VVFFEQLIPASIIAAIFSFGIYKFFISALNILFNKCDIVKRITLRNEYLHGNWVGYYFGEGGKIRYVNEEINQTFDEIIITGRAYDENGDLNSSWNSEAVSLNGKYGKLVYTYNVEGKNSTDDGTGIVKFRFSNSNFWNPSTLEGIYTDLHYGKRREIYEKRVKEKKLDKKAVISIAKKIYDERNK